MTIIAADLPEKVIPDHVRRPDFPWRDGKLTECNRSIDDVRRVITRDELEQRVKNLGVIRARYVTCQVCLENVTRWPTWEADPVGCMGRQYYGGRRDQQLTDELRALAALVKAHPEEFQEYLAALGNTTSLADKRNASRTRATGRRRPS